MRKLVSLLLALAMLATLCVVPAMAETAKDPLTVTVFVSHQCLSCWLHVTHGLAMNNLCIFVK